MPCYRRKSISSTAVCDSNARILVGWGINLNVLPNETIKTVYCNLGVLKLKWSSRRAELCWVMRMRAWGMIAGPRKFWQSGCSEVHSSAFLALKRCFVGGHATLHFILTRIYKRRHCLLPPLHRRKCMCSDKPDIGMFDWWQNAFLWIAFALNFQRSKIIIIATLPSFSPIQSSSERSVHDYVDETKQILNFNRH